MSDTNNEATLEALRAENSKLRAERNALADACDALAEKVRAYSITCALQRAEINNLSAWSEVVRDELTHVH